MKFTNLSLIFAVISILALLQLADASPIQEPDTRNLTSIKAYRCFELITEARMTNTILLPKRPTLNQRRNYDIPSSTCRIWVTTRIAGGSERILPVAGKPDVFLSQYHGSYYRTGEWLSRSFKETVEYGLEALTVYVDSTGKIIIDNNFCLKCRYKDFSCNYLGYNLLWDDTLVNNWE